MGWRVEGPETPPPEPYKQVRAAQTPGLSVVLLEAWQATPLTLYPQGRVPNSSRGTAPGWLSRISGWGALRRVWNPQPFLTQRF